MHRPISTLNLSSSVKVKLVGAGFQFTADLQQVEAAQLCREAGLSQEEAQEVLQVVGMNEGGGDLSGSLNALQLLQKEEEMKSIVTFSSRLDGALGGGVPMGKITEFCGIPGVGKTQLCLQLSVDVQVPQCFGGVEGQVMFIDTERTFVLERFVEIATAAVRHCSLLAEDEEQRAAMATFTVESILSNIFLVRCHNYMDLMAELHRLRSFLSEQPKIGLLVIDSVASPFRDQLDDFSQRSRLLGGLYQQLIAMATEHHIAVVTTNQMTTRVLEGGRSQLIPALGELWGHAPTVRLHLQWEGRRRVASVVKSPTHPCASVEYQINSEGFRDADQLEQPDSKRRRTNNDQSASSTGESSR